MNYDLIVRVVGGEGFLPVTRDNQGFGYLPVSYTHLTLPTILLV